MCHLPGTVNVPYDDIHKPDCLEALSNLIKSNTDKEGTDFVIMNWINV